MLDRLGISGALSLLAGVSALLCAVPFLFLAHGERIRARSRFCAALRERRAELARRVEDQRRRRTKSSAALLSAAADAGAGAGAGAGERRAGSAASGAAPAATTTTAGTVCYCSASEGAEGVMVEEKEGEWLAKGDDKHERERGEEEGSRASLRAEDDIEAGVGGRGGAGEEGVGV